jgi:hypothetical protein
VDPDRFHNALDLSPEQRSAYLDRSYTADAALRHEVKSLLVSHDSGPAAPDRSVWETANLSDGYWIGRRVAHYEGGPEIDRGGLGVVHAAHDIELDRDNGRQADAREFRPCHADQRAIAYDAPMACNRWLSIPMGPTARPSW